MTIRAGVAATLCVVLQRHCARRVSRPAAHLRCPAARGQLPRGGSGQRLAVARDPPRTKLRGVVVLAIALGVGLWAADIAAAPETAQWNAPAAGQDPKPEGRPAPRAAGLPDPAPRT
jgi:hypothetical protein